MASGVFRSNTNASTNLTVSLYEIWRSGTIVGMRCAWSVTTGSNSSLGTGAGNDRVLKITHVNGTLLSAAEIKSSSVWWNTSSTYSGSWDFSFDTGSYNAHTQSMIPSTSATGTQACIWTTYVSQLDVDISATYSAIGTPQITSISPVIFETVVNLAWNAAADGINNAVSSYRVYYNLNGGGYSFVDAGMALSYALPIVGVARGTTMSFYVVAMDSQGSSTQTSVYSGYVLNRTPNTPTSASVPKSSYIPGEIIRVSFSNNGDPDNNADHIEIYSSAHGGVIATGAAVAGYVDLDTTGWAQGLQTYFHVRLVDVFGVVSAWSNQTVTVTLNVLPNPPVINYPVAGATVYRLRPHVLLTAGVANDGPQAILATQGKNTRDNGSQFSCGTTSYLSSAQQVVYQSAEPWGSTPSFAANMFDGYLDSTSVGRTFNIAALTLTDPTITPSVTKCKAVHITELQTAINNLRAAYGIAAYSFTACVAGTSLISNAAYITQLQTALQAVITLINGWDTSNGTFDISVSWISVAATGGGVDAVKLRQAIEQLRTTIPLI